MPRDGKMKRAENIQKNINLQQVFMFAHPVTSRVSQIWDLFSENAIQLENSWNVSFRRTFDLPMQTHRYLVEPVSGHVHLKKLLIKRFISFLNQINKSNKFLPKSLLNCIKNDTRSTTGSNIRRILLLTKKDRIEDVTQEDIENIKYAEMPDEESWRVGMIKDMTDRKFGQLVVEGFSDEECETMLAFACTGWITPFPSFLIFCDFSGGPLTGFHKK